MERSLETKPTTSPRCQLIFGKTRPRDWPMRFCSKILYWPCRIRACQGVTPEIPGRILYLDGSKPLLRDELDSDLVRYILVVKESLSLARLRVKMEDGGRRVFFRKRCFSLFGMDSDNALYNYTQLYIYIYQSIYKYMI